MAVLKRLKFRTVILLGSLASFIMVFLVTTGILLASRWSDQLVRMDRTLDNMTHDISELVILAHEYVSHREDRPRLQWLSKHQQVSNRLQEVIGLELPYADVQSEMQKYVREASTLFDRLCRLHQRTTELTPEVKVGLQERLSGQLLATLQTLLTHSNRLTELNSQWMNARRQRAFDLMMAGVVILGVFITWLFQLLGRRIGQHLLMLNQGVSQIANGQLEQRLEKLAEDEIGQLTDGINTMCQQLCQITVSRASLVEEVEQRRLVEDALRRERDLVQGYLQVAAFILLVLDRHGKIDYINPEGCRVLGVGQQELLGQNWFARFMLPQEREHLQSFYSDIMVDKQAMPDTFFNAIVTRQDEIRWITWRNVLLWDAGGAPYGSLSSGMDITERLRDERALREAKEEAERANQAKTLFLASMSHELRTPLNGILGLIRLLGETSLDPSQQEYVTIINEAGEALLRIVNDILDLSKIESGRLEMEQVELDIRQVVGNVLSLMAVRCREKGLALSQTVEPVVPLVVVGDPVRLQQILFNLVGNATKFTHEGTIRVQVGVILREEQPFLEFVVVDSGIGMPPETVEHLFMPFKQADNTITRRFGGTGLGLVISRQLVEAMGGEIQIESVQGQGTTVRFTIPLLLHAVEKPVVVEKTVSAPKGQLNLLLVEDDPISTMAAKGLLTHQGHLVYAVASAEEALRYLVGHPCDAIIMDVHLPGMNGDEAVRHIRAMADPAIARLPIVGLTANAFYEERAGYLAAGMDAVLAKPVSPERLLSTIAQVREKVLTGQKEGVAG